MVRIKICGIRRNEDIEYLNKYSPDYAGFIFVPDTKRYIEPLKAVKLINRLSNRIKSVGVFVNEDIERIIDIVNTCSLDVVQLHGDESVEYILELRKHTDVEAWKVFRVNSEMLSSKELRNKILEYPVKTILMDTYNKNAYGGTGETFDWKMLSQIPEIVQKYNVIIAGGISPDNIQRLLSSYVPYGIDVSSGVETDGVKDEVKIKRVMETFKE